VEDFDTQEALTIKTTGLWLSGDAYYFDLYTSCFFTCSEATKRVRIEMEIWDVQQWWRDYVDRAEKQIDSQIEAKQLRQEMIKNQALLWELTHSKWYRAQGTLMRIKQKVSNFVKKIF
jgi:hypothetical protein